MWLSVTAAEFCGGAMPPQDNFCGANDPLALLLSLPMNYKSTGNLIPILVLCMCIFRICYEISGNSITMRLLQSCVVLCMPCTLPFLYVVAGVFGPVTTVDIVSFNKQEINRNDFIRPALMCSKLWYAMTTYQLKVSGALGFFSLGCGRGV